MTWFKVDDGFHDDPKVLELRALRNGRRALGLWLLAGSWCSDKLTGGFVSAGAVKGLACKADAELLADAGLWERVDGGYRFHNWGKWQPDADALKALRDAARERAKRHRDRKRDERDASRDGDVTDDVAVQESNASPREHAYVCAGGRAPGPGSGTGSGISETGEGVGEGVVVVRIGQPVYADERVALAYSPSSE